MSEPGAGQPPQQPLQPPGDLYGGPPPPPPPPGGAGVPPLPWEDRERRGFFPALFETVKLFVTAPSEAYARAKERGDFLSPILFAVIIGWVAGIVGQLWSLLFQGAWISMFPPEMRDQIAPMMATSGLSFVISLIITPILILLSLFISSGIVHLCLMMLGGHKQSTSGYEGTFRAVSYAQVSALGQLIPFVGLLITIVWGLVLEVLGLVRMHRTTTGKAVGAVLLPILLCCLCASALVALMFGAIMSAIGGNMR